MVYDEAHILHRDINPENLMVKVDANGTHEPFLIDFDFAKDVDRDLSEAHVSTHRTMSTPFLAVDLLSDSPPPALYRHDLESFYWCLWWIAVSYKNGNQQKTSILEGWYNGKWDDIVAKKLGMMMRVKSTPLTENMKNAGPILEKLAQLFLDEEKRRKRRVVSPPDVVTWESFRACL